MNVDGKYLDRINADLGTSIAPFELGDDFNHFGADGSVGAKKKPLWVCGKVFEYKGNAHFFLTYGDLRGGSKFQMSSYDLKDQTPQFRKAHNDHVKEIEDKARKKKESERDAAIALWKPRFYACNPTSMVHEYLAKKCVSSNFRARVDYKNTLLIPLEGLDDDGNLGFEGVQMIWRDAATMEWFKMYNFGLVKKGAFTRVGEFDLKKSEFVYLCEGYATACSVFMATKTPTVCAFDSGNLDLVIDVLKRLNPDVKVVICADDDFQTVIGGKQVNVGILKAIACQKKFPNVTYRKPRFSNRTEETDFNDLHILEGVEVVADQLKINRAEFVDVILLGHRDHEEFFYLCTQSKSIVSLRSSQHDGKYLKAIANEKYWAEKYGYTKDKFGNVVPDWNKISDTLLERQRDIGLFDHKRVRGLGVWQDDKRVLVNYGQGVYDASKKVCMSNIDPHLGSKKFYNAAAGEVVNFDDELTDDEALQVAEAIRGLNFKNEHDYVFVIGFLAIANVFGALSWRPHLWITAPAGSGKSWIIKQLHDLIYFSFFIKRGTLAGVQQLLDNNAKCVVYDEAEASETIEQVVAMARECSTNDGALVVKGTTGGKVKESEANACFLMSSIVRPVMNKADDSRFFFVDMNDNSKQTKEEFTNIKQKFANCEGMGQRLMVRMVNNVESLKSNIEVAKEALREKGISAREADQLSPIIAGFLMFFTRGVITKELVFSVADKMDLAKSDYIDRNDEKQEERCYEAFMQVPLNHQGMTIGLALQNAKAHVSDPNMHPSEIKNLLISHGVGWSSPHNCIALRPSITLVNKMKAMGFPNFLETIARSRFFLKRNVQHRLYGESNKKYMLLILDT